MTKKVIDRGKRSKPLSEVKPVENISKNPQSFLEISPVQKGSLSHIEQECQESLIQGKIHIKLIWNEGLEYL